MHISIISPPIQGGVFDYSEKVLENLDSMSNHLTWTHDSISEIESGIKSDCLFLQYSPYGYQNRGVPLWLVKQLQTNRPRIKTLGVFFHELYGFGPVWSSAFWLSPVQRYIVRRLAELSDFWITNREAKAQWLRRFAGDKPHAVLPVFSNVGEMPDYSPVRSSKIVIFGSSGLRLATYRESGNVLFSWAKQHGLEIHDIGPPIHDPIITNLLVSENVVVHGRLPEREISKLMSDAMFGVVAYLGEHIAKSGVFAAYCAHGICPVLISRNYPKTDGLAANHHYLAGITDNRSLFETANRVGRAAWQWYQPHNIGRHIGNLRRFSK